jgi:hypothetical protein
MPHNLAPDGRTRLQSIYDRAEIMAHVPHDQDQEDTAATDLGFRLQGHEHLMGRGKEESNPLRVASWAKV